MSENHQNEFQDNNQIEEKMSDSENEKEDDPNETNKTREEEAILLNKEEKENTKEEEDAKSENEINGAEINDNDEHKGTKNRKKVRKNIKNKVPENHLMKEVEKECKKAEQSRKKNQQNTKEHKNAKGKTTKMNLQVQKNSNENRLKTLSNPDYDEIKSKASLIASKQYNSLLKKKCDTLVKNSKIVDNLKKDQDQQ